MTSSLTMQVEAVTHTIEWLAFQSDAHIKHAIILTDSLNLLQMAESGMVCPVWNTAMHSLRLQRLHESTAQGMPESFGMNGQTRVSWNARADVASTADITSGLLLGRVGVLRGLWNFLNTDRPQHHSIDCLKEWVVEKGSGRYIPPSEVWSDLCSTRQILVLFRE